MKTIENIISDIQELYGYHEHSASNGVCDLCGYDTSIVNNCTLTSLPYKGKVLTVCTYCKTAAEKLWLGMPKGNGESINRIDTWRIYLDDLLNEMDDDKMAEFLSKRLNKRLVGYSSQKQMVPK